MMVLNGYLRQSAAEDAACRLYERVVAQAREPAFFAAVGVPDTLDGRFEMVALHSFLLLHRLKGEGRQAAELGQRLFDLMFADMDASLRELGVGDLGVGRRVKQMARGFYGRIAAYDSALRQEDAVLSEALRRNLFGTVRPAAGQLAAMAAYMRLSVAGLARQPIDALLAGKADFPAPPQAPAGEAR